MLLDTKILAAGLVLQYIEGGLRYTLGANTLEFNGEQYAGECWINEVHYFYTVDEDTEIVSIVDDDNTVHYNFAYDEQAYEDFARQVLA